MNQIKELQDKVQTLQNQIAQKQAQILDYTTNKAYQKTYTYQENCGHLGCMELGTSCAPYKTATYNTKQTELTQAQSTLKSLQNQLQAALAKKQEILARLLAQCSTPPRTELQACTRIISSLESLQANLAKAKTIQTSPSKNLAQVVQARI